MGVGLQITRGEVDATVGSLALQLEVALRNIQAFKAWLDTQTDPNLIALPGGATGPYVQADVNLLRSAVGDMDQLRAIHDGAATLLVLKDFRAFVKLIDRFGF